MRSSPLLRRAGAVSSQLAPYVVNGFIPWDASDQHEALLNWHESRGLEPDLQALRLGSDRMNHQFSGTGERDSVTPGLSAE